MARASPAALLRSAALPVLGGVPAPGKMALPFFSPSRASRVPVGSGARPGVCPLPPMDDLISKARVLHEALPYIRRFQGRTFVVKYGGHAMVDNELKESFSRDVCLLRYVGIRVVVVHGGGPQINRMLERVGISSTFSGGLRVTDDETMELVEMVLGGGVNQEIVGMICQHGGRAIGLSGKDDRFMLAKKVDRVPTKDEHGRDILVDLGRVGEVVHVETGVVEQLT